MHQHPCHELPTNQANQSALQPQPTAATTTIVSNTWTNYQQQHTGFNQADKQKASSIGSQNNKITNNKTVYTRIRIRSYIERENSSSTTNSSSVNNDSNDEANHPLCEVNTDNNTTSSTSNMNETLLPTNKPTMTDGIGASALEASAPVTSLEPSHPSSPSSSQKQYQQQAKSKRSRYILSSASRKKLTSLAMNIIGNASASSSVSANQQQQPHQSQHLKSSTMASILDTTKDYSKDNSSIIVLKSSTTNTINVMNANSCRQDSLDDIEVIPSHRHLGSQAIVVSSHHRDLNNNNSDNRSNNTKDQNNKTDEEKADDETRLHSVHLPKSNNIVTSNSLSIATTNKSITNNPNDNNGATIKFETIEREHWDKNIEFLLAVIGFAVDLGNIWRFPYVCYSNGGGAFLIPYIIMFALGGLPIFYLEMSLGQYHASGCLTVWKRVCPLVKGIGYAMCIINFYTGLFYNTIISWAFFYLLKSFTSELPWTRCDNSWNTKSCRTVDQRHHGNTSLPSSMMGEFESMNFTSPSKEFFDREVLQINLSKGIDDLGSIRWPLASYLAIVFIFVYFAIWKGVKSTGKAVWITALLPYFVLIPLLIRSIFLDGASNGISYYLKPNFSRLSSPKVWVDAAQQIFFSLGPGFGTLLALSSYNKFNHNCFRDAVVAASVNLFTSFIAGFVVFSVLGYMANMQHQDIARVASNGTGLVFDVYPEALANMEGSWFWSILFFTMVIALGMDSTFGGLEAVITGLCDEYPRVLRAHREIFIGCLLIVIYLCSLPTTTFGGYRVVDIFDNYGTSLSLLFVVFIETASVCWIYGVERFSDNLEEMYGYRPGIYWRICWTYISPTLILCIFIAAIINESGRYKKLETDGYTYPSWAVALGWLLTTSSLVCIPVYAIYLLARTPGTLSQRIKKCIKPIEKTHLDDDELGSHNLKTSNNDSNSP